MDLIYDFPFRDICGNKLVAARHDDEVDLVKKHIN